MTMHETMLAGFLARAERREPHLTDDDEALMRRPFSPLAVKWLPTGGITTRRTMRFTPYIDGSLVYERLRAVDPCAEWLAWPEAGNGANDPYGLAHMAPFVGVMQVKGVVVSQRGQLAPGWDKAPPKPDEKHVKSAETDALKRCAWAFGVGSYLRAFPEVYLPEVAADGVKLWLVRNANGKERFGGLNAPGKRTLRAEYEKVVGHELFIAHYGATVDYGDAIVEADDEVPAERTGTLTAAMVEVLVLLSRFNGRSTTPEHVRARYEGTVGDFPKLLPEVLNGVVQEHGIPGSVADDLRLLAMQAASGDEATAFAAGIDLEGRLTELAGGGER